MYCLLALRLCAFSIFFLVFVPGYIYCCADFNMASKWHAINSYRTKVKESRLKKTIMYLFRAKNGCGSILKW